MAQMAVSFLDFMQGTILGLEQGISTDMHVRNVSAHVKNALHHTSRNADIDASAGRLIVLAQTFGRQHSGFAFDQAEKAARVKEISLIREAYLHLRGLIDAAEPSADSRALGG